jgi:hypothetical protein
MHKIVVASVIDFDSFGELFDKQHLSPTMQRKIALTKN